MPNSSTKFQGVCTGFKVQGCCMLLRGSRKHDSRGGGEGVPTNLRGKLTESQLRKSKNWTKMRRQKNRTKSRAKKGSKIGQNPAKATFDAKNLCESDIWRKKSLRKRHFAKSCANGEDGRNTAPMPANWAEAYSELRRAPARPSGKTREPQRGSNTRRGPHWASGKLRAPFSNLNFFVKNRQKILRLN